MFNPFGGGVNYKAPMELITRTVKTKVMCTIGQTNSSKRDLAKLLIAGMNIARFNASHGTHAVKEYLKRKKKKEIYFVVVDDSSIFVGMESHVG
jgi:hypothetical protein